MPGTAQLPGPALPLGVLDFQVPLCRKKGLKRSTPPRLVVFSAQVLLVGTLDLKDSPPPGGGIRVLAWGGHSQKEFRGKLSSSMWNCDCLTPKLRTA